jgi:hypothetical protein
MEAFQHEDPQLAMLVRQGDPKAVLDAVREIFGYHYPQDQFRQIEEVFQQVERLFKGTFSGYLPCTTEYHDLTHTLDVFLATARLLDGRNLGDPLFSCENAVNLLLAALLHDTGYIKEEGDFAGTGAKYTRVHVERSRQFVEKNRDRLGFDNRQASRIGKFISCTGLTADGAREFEMADDVLAGSILGTADLLGQMSDRAYLEKLLFLYYEFREAGFEGYNTEFDILRKTLDFYQTTRERLEHTLLKCYIFAEDHFRYRFSINENLYIKAIERQMDYLRVILEDESGNFRHKLKRIDLEAVEDRCRVY